MQKIMNFYNRFAALYRAKPMADYKAERLGWLEAWLSSQDKRFDAWRYENTPMPRAVIDFIADRFIETDPSPDKRYMDCLARWFHYGMPFNQLAKAKELLERYDADTKQGIEYKFERFDVPTFVYRKGAQKNKPMKQNFLKEIKQPHELEKFFHRFDKRQRFCADIQRTQERDETFTNSGDVIVLHTSPALRVYNIVTGKAERAYAKGTDFRDADEEDDLVNGLLQVERSDGARYRIYLHGLYAADESARVISLERMLREIPELVSNISSQFVEAKVKGSSPHQRGAFLAIASRVCSHEIVPEGYVSSYFNDAYQNVAALLGRGRELSARSRKSGNATFHQFSTDLRTLSRFHSDRKQISGEFVKQIFALAISEDTAGEALKSLPIISTVQHWRQAIQPVDILPLYQASAREPHDIVELFCMASRIASWRNGEEATYLPQAIGHLLETKNWAKLKTILACACFPNDEASEKWRQAITQEERNRIDEYRFDNEYKHHHIDILLERLNALDRGTYRPYRLRETPIGARGVEQAKMQEERIRRMRREKILALI